VNFHPGVFILHTTLQVNRRWLKTTALGKISLKCLQNKSYQMQQKLVGFLK
jgi:hypothetical protein